MKRYFLWRLALLAPTAFGAVTLVFFLIHMIPGDPVEVMLGESASSFEKDELRRTLGLDRPLREAQIAGEGNNVDLLASFTEEEIQRVLGLVALGGLSGG